MLVVFRILFKESRNFGQYALQLVRSQLIKRELLLHCLMMHMLRNRIICVVGPCVSFSLLSVVTWCYIQSEKVMTGLTLPEPLYDDSGLGVKTIEVCMVVYQ